VIFGAWHSRILDTKNSNYNFQLHVMCTISFCNFFTCGSENGRFFTRGIGHHYASIDMTCTTEDPFDCLLSLHQRKAVKRVS